MSLDFTAIDFETANNSESFSICEVGVVCVSNGQIVDRFSSLVNPHTRFSRWCIRVHGIKPDTVADSPSFDEVWPRIRDMIFGNVSPSSPTYIVVHNRSCDVRLLEDTLAHFGISCKLPPVIDTLNLAHGFMPDLPSYRLCDLCSSFGYTFHAHNALADAEACAYLLMHLADITGSDSMDSLSKLDSEFYPARIRKVAHHIDPFDPETLIDSPVLIGHSVVFTGDLDSMDRETAQCFVRKLGGNVTSSTSKNTSIVVVGTYPPGVFAGEHSDKHQLALDLIAKGFHIEIIDESGFLSILRGDSAPSVPTLVAAPICSVYSAFLTSRPLIRPDYISLRSTSSGASLYFNRAKVASFEYTPESGVTISFNSSEYTNGFSDLLSGTEDPLYAELSINPASAFTGKKILLRNLPDNRLLFDYLEYVCFQQINDRFGCCNDFVRCSDAMHCLHKDDVEYLGCYYRENLDAGRIFYGKNKNI